MKSLAAQGITVDPEYFHNNGVGIVRNFASPAEVKAMMARMAALVEGWDPSASVEFLTDRGQEGKQGSSNYFLDSAEAVHFFMDKGGLDLLKTGARETKAECLNKVGHDLHSKDPVFAKYSTSPRVAALTRALGWVDPVLPQSMYIFKQANGGDEVTSH